MSFTNSTRLAGRHRSSTRWGLVLVALGLLGASACGDDRSGYSPPERSDAFHERACRFTEPRGDKVTCGSVDVPLDRDNPGEEEATIQVAVFEARTEDPAEDPLIYLDGGPGSRTLESLDFTFNLIVDPFLDERDVIVFDQRGSGYSRPALTCPGLDDVSFDALTGEYTDEEQVEEIVEAVSDCREDVGENLDPSLISTRASAEDVEDLRIALGYDDWNLLGVSYGTRLALEVLNRHPEHVRSVILDSAYPRDASLVEAPLNLARALQQMFDDCEADFRCDAAYPDLNEAFYDTIAFLNDEPQEVSSEVDFIDFEVDGDRFATMIAQAMYTPQFHPIIPSLIYEVKEEDYESLGTLLSLFGAGSALDTGAYLSIECAEGYGFSDADDLEDLIDGNEEYEALASGTSQVFDICEAWDVDGAPESVREPVVSNVPALVIAGEYDHVTPPSWGVRVAEGLSHSDFYRFPGAGHIALAGSDCAVHIARSFLEHPRTSPDDGCLEFESPPNFVPLQ